MEKNNGFILLELIIVLFLATLIMGISVVFFANLLPSNRLDATVRNISATIKYARSMAQIQNEKQTVIVDLDARQYGIEGRGLKDIPSGVGIKIIDPFSGEILEGKYSFIFQATGNIEGGTIVLWNSKKSISIQTDPILGSVSVQSVQ
jgi:type II secretory pathway pseudopilin PulG